jgi:hypothetical protein
VVSGDPRVALLVQLGHGKTAVAATALADLGAWPALVVAPARVAREVWAPELAAWEHLANLKVAHVGDGLRSGRAAPMPEDAHVECVSYEQLWHLSEAVDLERRYRAVVFDELDKMKAPGSVRFRRVRNCAMGIPVRLGMTGTPVGNHLMDLWGELFMVGGEGPLGPTFTDFQARYFEDVGWRHPQWRLKHGHDCALPSAGGGCCRTSADCEASIHLRARPWCFSIPPQPEARVPPVVPHSVRCRWPAGVARVAGDLERQLFAELDSGAELEALSASAVAQKLRQLAGGAVYLGGGEDDWDEVHGEKLAALSGVLDELQGAPALVFYWFRHERERVGRELDRARRAWAHIDDPRAMERWDRGELEALLLQPESAGHGLNLQAGGAHAVWYTLPWSTRLRLQGDGRLARVGQRAPSVTSCALLCGPTDDRVAAILEEKAGYQRRFLDSLTSAV